LNALGFSPVAQTAGDAALKAWHANPLVLRHRRQAIRVVVFAERLDPDAAARENPPK
jgi:hypothetical protein